MGHQKRLQNLKQSRQILRPRRALADAEQQDAVRQLLQWADKPPPSREPLDPRRYPEYLLLQPRLDLAAYNRLLIRRASSSEQE